MSEPICIAASLADEAGRHKIQDPITMVRERMAVRELSVSTSKPGLKPSKVQYYQILQTSRNPLTEAEQRARLRVENQINLSR